MARMTEEAARERHEEALRERNYHPLTWRRVDLHELLDHLLTPTDIASSTGSQCDRLAAGAIIQPHVPEPCASCGARAREGATQCACGAQMPYDSAPWIKPPAPDHAFHETTRIEMALARRAGVLRCVDMLERIDRVRFVEAPHLTRFARHAALGQGKIVVSVLRAYEAWKTVSDLRATAAVYAWMTTTRAELEPCADLRALAMAFGERRERKAFNQARTLYADSLMSAGAWVERWNRMRALDEEPPKPASTTSAA